MLQVKLWFMLLDFKRLPKKTAMKIDMTENNLFTSLGGGFV